MLFDSTFQKYLGQRPVAVMTRATLEHAFAAESLEELFERTAQRQYTEELAFSSVVAILQAVVFQQHPSVRSAYLHSPTEQASATAVAEVYGRRWRVGGSFWELTSGLRCELDTLGYPKAALLGFAIAVCACNVLRVACEALEEAQEKPAKKAESGEAEEPWEASSYAVAVELRTAYDGLVVGVPTEVWEMLSFWSASEFAAWLVSVARKTDCQRYQKSRRGPEKPVERVKAGRKASHRSTFRLLAQRTKSPKPST